MNIYQLLILIFAIIGVLSVIVYLVPSKDIKKIIICKNPCNDSEMKEVYKEIQIIENKINEIIDRINGV